MSTMQSKLVSRTIWLEKKKIWKINIQKNGIRKSFYSSTPGDKGRKICAQNAASWLSGSSPFAVSDHTTVETVFERYLKDKELETTNIYTIRNRYNNHIKPIIGKIPVMLLTKQDLKRVIYTAYLVSNLPLERQYRALQDEKPETWAAFLRRINTVRIFAADGSHKDYSTDDYFRECVKSEYELVDFSDDDCPF